MKPVLVVQHVPHEGLGTLAAHLAQVGLSVHPVRLYDAVPPALDLDRAAALIVMGGPMNVDETDKFPFLQAEVDWLRAAVAQELPVLGICLGAQLLAKALGARVYANSVKEIGWYTLDLTPPCADDWLFSGCGPTATVFQWHGDTFDLPPGAVHLAQSAQCRHQAFRCGRNAYGLQFHIEMTPDMIDTWLMEPGNRCELTSLTYVDPQAIRAQSAPRFAEMQVLGQHVLGRFAAMCSA